MRVEYLDYFVAVVEYGSISKAANALYISPQGLSQAIQKLEMEMNTLLFYRDGSRLTLTAAGEAAYEMARAIGEQSRELLQTMSEFRDTGKDVKPNTLNILSSPVMNATFLPKVLIQMRKRYPGLHISVHEVDTEKMLEQYEKHPGVIMLFSTPEPVFSQMMKDSPKILNYYELFRTPVKACVSVKSPLAKRKSISIKDFGRYDLVLYQVEERLVRLLDINADFSKVVLHASDLNMCRSMLSVEEKGIGFTNDVVDRYIKMNALISLPLVPSIDMILGCFMAPERRIETIVQEFLNAVTEELQK